MPQRPPVIQFSDTELVRLRQLTRQSTIKARQKQRAHILLLAHQGCSDRQIADAL